MLSLPLNAFQSVRPRGPDLGTPAAAPRKTNQSKAPAQGNVHMALDSKGRPTVGLEPRKSGFFIEGRDQGAESTERRKRIKGATR